MLKNTALPIYDPAVSIVKQLKEIKEKGGDKKVIKEKKETSIELSEDEIEKEFSAYKDRSYPSGAAYLLYERVNLEFNPIAVQDLVVCIKGTRKQRTAFTGTIEGGDISFTITDAAGKDLAGGQTVTPTNIDTVLRTLDESRRSTLALSAPSTFKLG